MTTGVVNGPNYDLIFGVNTFDPQLNTAVTISPYVYEGKLYVNVEKLPAHEGTVNTWVAFYRYSSKTGMVEKLPSPSASELRDVEKREQFIFSATKNLTLNTNEKSSDGYSLAKPEWVKVNLVSNLVGNIMLFILSGHFGDIKEREDAPRLAKDSISIAMKSEQPIFENEADDAFLLGWVVPDSPVKAKASK